MIENLIKIVDQFRKYFNELLNNITESKLTDQREYEINPELLKLLNYFMKESYLLRCKESNKLYKNLDIRHYNITYKIYLDKL
ncbi:hypothetical protein FWK35_00025732 [Aphis craccivora]|uniref:Uncharacterized protein n=1 Tax=Aphis craccivora TaxID=307492 RepID=A0A6G0VYL4_APHCR|nr:hypothetical protein FWK35_00025732 [Aphis craccivora]